MYYPNRRIGWHNYWFRGTCWREELVNKRFRRTGWCNKWFREIGCGWKRSKKRSKCSCSHYQQNFRYSHYQQNFNTKFIDQPNHLSCRPTNYPSRRCRCGGRTREFEPAPDRSPAGEGHRRGTPLRAHLTDYWEGNRDRKGQCHAKGRFFLQKKA